MKRIEFLQKQMHSGGADLTIIMNPRDVFYYTGIGQPANLIIPKHGDPVLQVRRAWDFAIRETFLPESCVMKNGGLPEIEALVSKLPFPVRTMGLTLDAIPASLYKKIQSAFPFCSIVNVSPLILQQRSIKDEEEIKLIRKAAKCYESIHATILRELQPGITEVQLSAKILETVRAYGCESIVYNRRWDASLPPDGLVISSANIWQISGHAMTVTGKGLSAALPWGASKTAIAKGDLVVVDLGINYHGYQADIARTYVVGKANNRQKEVFEAVRSLLEMGIVAIKEDVLARQVYEAVYHKAVDMQVDAYFQGYGEMQGNYIGHGLGLELDEPPTLQAGNNTVLKSGMTLAVEPKLIIPEWGAIDLEDNVLVTKDGCELISTVPRELFEV